MIGDNIECIECVECGMSDRYVCLKKVGKNNVQFFMIALISHKMENSK